MAQTHEARVYAGYRQFYVFDADNRGDTGSTSFWSGDAFVSRRRWRLALSASSPIPTAKCR